MAAFLIISRTVPSRQLLDEIDLSLLILFASLFVINDAFAQTRIVQEAMTSIISSGWVPNRISLLTPMTLFLSNTIGNVPAVVMLLTIWQGIPSGAANLIVAERAMVAGVRLSFYEHAKTGVPITVLSMLSAGLWLWTAKLMPL